MRLDPKDPDIATAYAIDIHDLIIPLARRDVAFEKGTFARPQFGTGYYYQVVNEDGGRTRRHWPAWPREDGARVIDGTVEWEAVHPAAATVPEISSVEWIVEGLTVADQTHTASVGKVQLKGGEDGEEYEVTGRFTLTDGRVIDQTMIVPVRQL